MPSKSAWVLLGAAVGLVACGAPAMQPRPGPAAQTAPGPAGGAVPGASAEPGGPATPAPDRSSPAPPDESDRIGDETIEQVLAKVAASRGLAVLEPVEAKRLGRSAVIAHIKAKVEREIPPGVLQAQGELLSALGLVPEDYDYVAGIYGLLEEQVAGFYDPEIGALVLLDDLDEAGVEETLVHELVHALQDQHYDLDRQLEYRPHDSDAAAAVQALSEGDATHVMFDAVAGSAFAISEQAFRLALVASTALSQAGGRTPRVLQAALIAPYVDGFRLVGRLRREGDWPAVDAMWRRPPASTEQVLHLDKYRAGDAPVELPVPSLDELGPGFRPLDHDVLGEQGLRITLEQWVATEAANGAAAGWGGDRYVVAERAVPLDDGGPATELAAAWLVQMDTRRDAAELAQVLAEALGRRCRERPKLGAITWLRRGRSVVIAAGPFRRGPDGTRLGGAASCGKTRRWAAAMLRR